MVNAIKMEIFIDESEDDNGIMCAIEDNNKDDLFFILDKIERERSQRYWKVKSEQCLLYSIYCGNNTLAVSLMREVGVNAKCETADGTKCQPIHLAVKAKSSELVSEIINQGASVNRKNGLGKYPLDLAIECEDLEMVKLLVSHGAKVNKFMPWLYYEEGVQPIQRAIILKNSDIFQFLLANGADSKCVDSKGNTAVQYAVKYEQFEMLEVLLNNGGDVNTGSPLSTALKMQNFEIVALLLKHKAKVKQTNKDAIVYAIPLIYHKDSKRSSDLHSKIYTEIIRLSHAYLNETDHASGYTPLHYAAEKDSLDIVQILLEYGADINVKTRKEKLTPLWLSVCPGGSPAMAQFLIEFGAQVQVYNKKGGLLNQLMLSANSAYFSSTYIDLIKLLLERGVRVNSLDDRNLTPLERYILLSNISYLTDGQSTWRNKEVIAELVSAGAKIHLLCSTNRAGGPWVGQHLSVLCRGTWYGDFDTSRFLIDAGLNIHKEKWIHFRSQKPEVENFLCSLRDISSQPLGLAVLCRNVIREKLSQCNGDLDIRIDIEQLNIPIALQKFLKLEPEIKLYLQ